MKKHHLNEKFPGFPSEPNQNFWQYPKALNGFWHQLSGSEQKVLDYIVRHTWGWKKTADRISLSQFKYGIKTRNEVWIDKGTGIRHNQTLTNALKSLEEKGFIFSVKKSGKTTEYILRVVQGMNTPNSENEQVGSSRNEHTTNNVSINNKQYSDFFENLDKCLSLQAPQTPNEIAEAYKKGVRSYKPFYMGNEMRWKSAERKWYVIEKGQWLEYADKESKIEWK